jgi:hypothetical protein
MSLQAKLDAFKADFEAGKPALQRSSLRHRDDASRHRRTDRIRSGQARQEGRRPRPDLLAQGSGGQHRELRRPAKARPAGAQLLPRRLVPVPQHGAAGARSRQAGVRQVRSLAGRDLAADRSEQPQVGASEQPVLPDPVGREGQGRHRVRPALRSARLSGRALQAAQERSADVQRRPELDAADAGPLCHRTGRRHPCPSCSRRPRSAPTVCPIASPWHH